MTYSHKHNGNTLTTFHAIDDFCEKFGDELTGDMTFEDLKKVAEMYKRGLRTKNQCDACNAGIYRDVQGMHRDDESNPIMVCQDYKYG